jgi:hypothetical protein
MGHGPGVRSVSPESSRVPGVWGEVYMIVPHGLVPMSVLGEALLGKGASQAFNE